MCASSLRHIEVMSVAAKSLCATTNESVKEGHEFIAKCHLLEAEMVKLEALERQM